MYSNPCESTPPAVVFSLSRSLWFNLYTVWTMKERNFYLSLAQATKRRFLTSWWDHKKKMAHIVHQCKISRCCPVTKPYPQTGQSHCITVHLEWSHLTADQSANCTRTLCPHIDWTSGQKEIMFTSCTVQSHLQLQAIYLYISLKLLCDNIHCYTQKTELKSTLF